MGTKGTVAAGHKVTAQAAIRTLAEGGNAFDAALAALFAGCVAEPVLASLGGGGFLLARAVDEKPVLYDFFTQTPHRKSAQTEVDFYPILADFGTAQQEFHIGLGSIATPGVVKGVFAIHRDLCRLPLGEIIEPACEAARSGVEINDFQHYISDIVSPIIKSSPEALKIHATERNPEAIAAAGERVHHHAMADAFEALAIEGERLFYLGDMGEQLVRACRQGGGYLRSEDLAQYRLVRRQPLELNYRGSSLFTNPPPSVGGALIAFALALLEPERLGQFTVGSFEHLVRIGQAQKITQQLRQDRGVDRNLDDASSASLLSNRHVRMYREVLAKHLQFSRGTTQISIADQEGNFASMTLSNGEGSGYVIPGTGIVLNNMLGEEDINPHGFHQWPENQRIASMMSPTLVFSNEGRIIATGSGGSNRIRSAILQVLINLLDYDMDIGQAVEQERVHYESGTFNVEYQLTANDLRLLEKTVSNYRLWPQKNLFFGGAHSVMKDAKGELRGKGDSRRGGVWESV